MPVTRRVFLGSAMLVAAAPLAAPALAFAQDASPVAEAGDAPGYGIVRVRTVGSPELNQAVFPDVMYRFLPKTAAVDGYAGYVFAVANDDPASSLTMTLLSDEAAVAAANDVAKEYVAGLDPRLAPETPLAEQGPVRIWEITARPASEVPPHLTGCQITFRHRINAEETDIEGIIKTVNDELIPGLREMDGFVLYGWLGTPDGRISFNIWETADQLAAGDQYVADFVATHPIVTTNGTTDVYAGTIGYSDILGTA
ncbi:MAG TPA: hypothetical protein VFP05_13920 [Thermomicrobiales bacterium]|nr:hypothetical protein [Thermomicrobiales bacterium]